MCLVNACFYERNKARLVPGAPWRMRSASAKEDARKLAAQSKKQDTGLLVALTTPHTPRPRPNRTAAWMESFTPARLLAAHASRLRSYSAPVIFSKLKSGRT